MADQHVQASHDRKCILLRLLWRQHMFPHLTRRSAIDRPRCAQRSNAGVGEAIRLPVLRATHANEIRVAWFELARWLRYVTSVLQRP